MALGDWINTPKCLLLRRKAGNITMPLRLARHFKRQTQFPVGSNQRPGGSEGGVWCVRKEWKLDGLPLPCGTRHGRMELAGGRPCLEQLCHLFG